MAKEALGKISNRDRDMVINCTMLDMTQAECARLMSVSQVMVSRRICRAMTMIRKEKAFSVAQ